MGLTVKGAPMNQGQVRCAQALLGVGKQLSAGSLAAQACIFDSIYESGVGEDRGPNSAGYCGPLGGNVSYGFVADASGDANMATSFYQGGKGFQGGGAIALARRSSDIAYIGSQTTAAVPFNSQGYSTQYLSQGFSFGSAIAEAKAIVAAMGGGTLTGGIAGSSSGSSGTVPDGSAATTWPFSISGTGNPDEDFWTGINRLAQEVNWYLFSNGEYLYYLDGQEMLAQKPALTLDRVADAARIHDNQGNLSYDDTAFNYVSDHKRRFRVQRRTKVAVAQSPTEGTFELICGIDEVLGGDVVELSSFGLGDGRWILAEVRRSVFDVFSEITLVPAIAPITEAVAAGTTGTGAGSAGGTNFVGNGKLAKVADLATRAAQLQSQRHCYTYTPGPGRTNNGNGVLSPPYTYDCSGFTEACYRFAGLGDPAGNTGYAGSSYDIGGPGTHSTACDQVSASAAVPGDCVVFPDHVAVYLGDGNCVSMGAQGEPSITTVAAEAAYKSRGVTGYFHLKGAS